MPLSNSDLMLARYVSGTKLSPAFLTGLKAAMLAPESEPLRLLLAHAEEEDATRFASTEAGRALVARGLAEHPHLFVSEALERGAVAGPVRQKTYGAAKREGRPDFFLNIKFICAECVRAGLPLAGPFAPEELDRVLRARALAIEEHYAREPFFHRMHHISRAIVVPGDVTGDPDRLALYLSLIARFERGLVNTVGKEFFHGGAMFFEKWDIPLLGQMRAAAGEAVPGLVLAAWKDELNRRRALRSEIVAQVSPHWRDLFQRMIDAPGFGDGEREKRYREIFEPVARMEEAARAQVLADIKALQARFKDLPDKLTLVSVHNEGLPRVEAGFNAWRIFERLARVLSATPEQRAAYFGPPPGIPDYPAFVAFARSVAGLEAKRPFHKRVATLIRSDRHDEAEKDLRALIVQAPPSELQRVLLATRWQDLRLPGWDELDTMLRKPDVTAISIDLSDHGMEDLEGPQDDIYLETGTYTDDAFPFSTSDRAAILAEGEDYGTAWQGSFEDIAHAVGVNGLSGLIMALKRHRTLPRHDWPDDLKAIHAAEMMLGEWWAQLCLHRAVVRQLETQPPHRSVPIIVGQHDFGWFISAVYYPGPPKERAAPPAPDAPPLDISLLANWDDRTVYRHVGEALERLFRAHRFEEARRFLVAQLKTRRHPIADLCLALEERKVEVLGWEKMQRLVLQADPRTGELPGAIQFNHSGQGDFGDGAWRVTYEDGSSVVAPPDWWMAGVEVTLLADEQPFRGDKPPLRFSQASLDEIVAAAPIGAAWPRRLQGGAGPAMLKGLEALHGALVRAEEDDIGQLGSDAAGGVFLATWYFGLRWHDAMARVLREQGLPRVIPVIVGTHGVDPSVKVAHMPTRSEAGTAEPAPPPAPPGRSLPPLGPVQAKGAAPNGVITRGTDQSRRFGPGTAMTTRRSGT